MPSTNGSSCGPTRGSPSSSSFRSPAAEAVGLLDRVRRRRGPFDAGPELDEEHALLDRYLRSYETPYECKPDPAESDVGRVALDAGRDRQAAIATAAIERLAWARRTSRAKV